MKKLAYAGALVLSFILGGVTTLVSVYRHHQPDALRTGATVSPEGLQRPAGPTPETVVENYF